MKHIAVIGAGISGLAAAYLLSRRHRVDLFERETRLGGHTHTVSVDSAEGPLALDTGFLVHNDRTYPLLSRLFRELGVQTLDSDMSFAVWCDRTGLAYSSRGANGFFAQRRNLFRPSHLALLRDILRFNREAPALLREPAVVQPTLRAFLDDRRLGEPFRSRYLVPMASAIWSASVGAILDFPAATLVRFLDNHGLLSTGGQPTWKVVRGGSHAYVPGIAAPLGRSVHTGVAITSVRRQDRGVAITFADRPTAAFDDVVFACHGDQILPLLADPTSREREVLSAFHTTPNLACLHTDDAVLPPLQRARASWNYRIGPDALAPPTVTYDLNRLQRLRTQTRYFVTLNPTAPIDERRVLRRIPYRHPLYTREAIAAQERWHEISGVAHVHYCGAYWRYGFHEDGLHSATRVAAALGVSW